jgi:uncharacterized repeat protein (TIGR01451 family)
MRPARMDAYPTPEKPVGNGTWIEYNIWVTNTADTAALEVIVADALPEGSLFWGVTGGDGEFVKPGVLAWSFAAQLQSLRATRGNDAAGHPIVTVDWVIAGENGTLGYRVWRGASAERGEAVAVSDGLIAASGVGGTYAWVDAAPPGGAAYYWIEEVGFDGAAVAAYGPAVAPPAEAGGLVYLPALTR